MLDKLSMKTPLKRHKRTALFYSDPPSIAIRAREEASSVHSDVETLSLHHIHCIYSLIALFLSAFTKEFQREMNIIPGNKRARYREIMKSVPLIGETLDSVLIE